jgi:NADP-dependent 3-hydroxy acid dehydrogenase YdfG
MKSLQDRVALITGASRGLGKAIALELGGDGARLALIGRDETKLNETASEAAQLGADVHMFVTDVTREQQVHSLRKWVESQFDHVDILVNNAGINLRKRAIVERLNCEEKLALMRAYAKATRAYSQAVAQLGRAVGAVIYAEYEVVQRHARIARDRADEARLRLDEHIRQHKC